MSAPRFDLQSHSLHSDGALPPAAVVRAAADAGIEVLALTDHDTVDGVAEAVAEGRRAGVRIVPAAELSTVDAPHEDLHVLGYGIDPGDPALRAALADFRADRAGRAERMAAALEDLGFALDRAPLDARRAQDRPIGRPHLAAAVFGHPANAARIAAEGHRTPSDVLVAYLVPGAPAYRGRERPSVAEAIAAIHAAGGLAVWAHPFWDIEDPAAVLAAIDRYVALGLDGVEVFYPTHTAEHVALLDDACLAHGLLTTGSADFHGPAHDVFSRFGAFELHGRTPRLEAVLAHAS